MLSFVLNKNIPCEKMCQDVARLVDSYRNTNPHCGDIVLTISISKIIDSPDSLLPKIEVKEN